MAKQTFSSPPVRKPGPGIPEILDRPLGLTLLLKLRENFVCKFLLIVKNWDRSSKRVVLKWKDGDELGEKKVQTGQWKSLENDKLS